MSPTPEYETRLAAAPLDDVDRHLLDELRGLHEEVDPVPGDLLDRIKFAMSVASLEAEVAQIVRDESPVGVRSTDYDRVDTVTFATEGLNLMVTIEHRSDGLADVAGWVTEGDVTVELRERVRTREARADGEGRFMFAGVERGLVSFVLRRPGDRPAVITPAIEV